jgi:hypothetical protein
VYKSWSSSWCNFFLCHASSSVLGSISTPAPYSQTPSAYVLPLIERPNFTPI